MGGVSETATDTERKDLAELLTGGFAPTVILLREFHFDKTGVVLEGLPYSVWCLLEHMHRRQALFLDFMRNPGRVQNLWPDAYWPDSSSPGSEVAWSEAVSGFERDLREIITIVENPATPLFEEQANGKSIFWAAVANLQHNAYHIGQIKAIGRQLGVW